jgi:hypothetical protein
MKPSEEFSGIVDSVFIILIFLHRSIAEIIEYATSFVKINGFDVVTTKLEVNRRMFTVTLYSMVWISMVWNSIYDNWPQFDKIVQVVSSFGAVIIVSNKKQLKI